MTSHTQMNKLLDVKSKEKDLEPAEVKERRIQGSFKRNDDPIDTPLEIEDALKNNSDPVDTEAEAAQEEKDEEKLGIPTFRSGR